jgi:ATP-dependent exoDNAse (exonuclease V) beta subunit
MILLTPKFEEKINDLEENNTIDINIRRKYRSFSSILNSIKHNLIKYYKDLNKEDINLTKQYLYNNKSLTKLESSNIEDFEVIPIKIEETSPITQEHFSKNTHELITKEISNNMKFGLLIHETLEHIDFKKPQYDLIEDKFIKDKITKFLANPLLKDICNANIFKEYEFIYTENNSEYHGIIDLMIEYEDKIDIIDYKLSNIKDDNYLKQLNGYKEYISKISNKEINIYLYSIIGETIEKL